MTLATPMSDRLTIREAAKAARVPIKAVVDLLRDVLREDWLDGDSTIEPVMAQTATALIAERRKVPTTDLLDIGL